MSTPLPPEPHRSREELLDIVRRRSVVLRRQRRAKAAGAMTLALVVLGGGVAFQRGLGPHDSLQVTTAGRGAEPVPKDPPVEGSVPQPETTTTTSAAPSTTTTVVRRPQPTTSGPVTTIPVTVGSATPTTQPHPTTTTTSSTTAETATTSTTEPLVCRNSYDPRCGPFRWEPEPVKGPLTIHLSVLTESPRAGKPVQIRVVVDSPDTTIDQNCPDVSDGLHPARHCIAGYPACPDSPRAYGPWAPPEKRPDHYETTQTFTYETPGTYTVTFTYRTGYPGCESPGDKDPYRNSGTGTVTVKVRASSGGEGTSPPSTQPPASQPG